LRPDQQNLAPVRIRDAEAAPGFSIDQSMKPEIAVGIVELGETSASSNSASWAHPTWATVADRSAAVATAQAGMPGRVLVISLPPV
jgi:hypothetical protein